MADEWVETSVKVLNELGLHIRAATKLVQLASKFPCEIMLGKDGREVTAKSIMGLFTLVAPKGTTLKIRARGDKAAEAVEAIAKLITDKFGEDK